VHVVVSRVKELQGMPCLGVDGAEHAKGTFAKHAWIVKPLILCWSIGFGVRRNHSCG